MSVRDGSPRPEFGIFIRYQPGAVTQAWTQHTLRRTHNTFIPVKEMAHRAAP